MKFLFFMYAKFLKAKKSFHLFVYNKVKKGYIIHPTVNIGKNVRIENNLGGTIKIGAHTELMDGVLLLSYGGNITIGEGCSINPYTIIYGHGHTHIGNNVLIAGHCMIIPANHIFQSTNEPINKQGLTKLGVHIEDNVWIGHGCSILDGVTIGAGSVIAAGSVVTLTLPKNTVAAGAPARVIKER